MSKKSAKKLGQYLWRSWHQKLGLLAAFFIIFLSLSGIALNHTQTLGLGHKAVQSTWLLDHYGVQAPSKITVLPATSPQQQDIIVTDNYLWLGQRLLFESDQEIISAVQFNDFIVVLNHHQLHLFSQAGELVDQLGHDLGLPENIRRAVVHQERFLVETSSGWYSADEQFFQWQAISPPAKGSWLAKPKANDKQAVDQAQHQQASLQYRSQFLTWERVILDAHAGRLFGLFGVLVMDAIAIILVLLSITGCYMWLNYKRKHKRKKRKH